MDELLSETDRPHVDTWMAALEARHLADLRIAEVTRALRALSSAYVERRTTLSRGSALDTAGKRAAFALFYSPLHFLVTQLIVRSLGTPARPSRTIVDVGCGTGAAGAAWALEGDGRSRVIGLDRHPWAVGEAQWNYRQLGVDGNARRADVTRLRLPRGDVGVVAAYVLNELPEAARGAAWKFLIDAASRGPVLVIEPLARTLTPWWDSAAAEITAAGGRSDEWRFQVDLPPLLRLLDRSAGLDHRELTARSLFVPQG